MTSRCSTCVRPRPGKRPGELPRDRGHGHPAWTLGPRKISRFRLVPPGDPRRAAGGSRARRRPARPEHDGPGPAAHPAPGKKRKKSTGWPGKMRSCSGATRRSSPRARINREETRKRQSYILPTLDMLCERGWATCPAAGRRNSPAPAAPRRRVGSHPSASPVHAGGNCSPRSAVFLRGARLLHGFEIFSETVSEDPTITFRKQQYCMFLFPYRQIRHEKTIQFTQISKFVPIST